MVEFLTLFIWLSTGRHEVELGVAGMVAEVEVRLDDETVAMLADEPWAFVLDLGGELAPHELVAIARDDAGRELDRAVQWLNLDVRTASASMELVNGEAGRPEAVRLEWASVGQLASPAITLSFDGQALPVADPRHVPLPPYDLKELHFLSAELEFSQQRTVRLEASFGGLYGDRVTTELTAVPVVLDDGAKMPKVEAMRNWFVKSGTPLAIHAAEKGDAEVMVVRGPAAEEFLVAQAEGLRRLRGRRGRMGLVRLLDGAGFGGKSSVTFMSALAVPLIPNEVRRGTFATSPSFPADEHGLLWWAFSVRPLRFPLRLADSVAVAGMEAHATGRRRAVVLVLGADAEDPHGQDDSHIEAAVVREYLRQLRVPLYVWSTSDGEPDRGWGEVRRIGPPSGKPASLRAINRAVRAVASDLARQRIVWLEGRHLPQSIELSPQAVGLSLAGSTR